MRRRKLGKQIYDDRMIQDDGGQGTLLIGWRRARDLRDAKGSLIEQIPQYPSLPSPGRLVYSRDVCSTSVYSKALLTLCCGGSKYMYGISSATRASKKPSPCLPFGLRPLPDRKTKWKARERGGMNWIFPFQIWFIQEILPPYRNDECREKNLLFRSSCEGRKIREEKNLWFPFILQRKENWGRGKPLVSVHKNVKSWQ